ncbi:hypothetical protein NLI96_g386 [Meripilus lineatus]|uniref:choline-phosphate cytidylyltransferase n=1 Tax=Meripilus lineatus TaxID=2056292 RepID=A0AAD5VGL9_9APHY|nr:hypothetical protein NLI96_g386 [Physisporinus lineatus]
MHLHSSSQPIDSPAYDASEEDNDPLTDDAASTVSVATSASSLRPSAPPRPPQNSSMRPPPGPPAGPIKTRHALVASMLSSDEGVDSPTYDGDVESSTTAGPDDRISSSIQKSSTVSHHHYNSSASIASNSVSPITPSSQFPVDPATSMKLPELTPPLPTISVSPQQRHHHAHTVPRPTPSHPSKPTEPPPANISTAAFNPAKLSPLDIQDFVREVIEEGITVGTGAEKKVYKINEPPTWRPVRIYADGVYDLFHFGHALQLRQAKVSFPSVPAHPPLASASTSSASATTTPGSQSSVVSSHETDIPGVYLLVGVNSDEQCREHKSQTVMSHAERCEAVRHCRWVDEVVPDAPWVIGQEFLDKYKIDYVAHDQDPYGSAGHEDVYSYCKSQGKFLPTRRTPGISTSDLLARLVSGYRHRAWDKKLEKMGLRALMAEGSDWDESRGGSAEGSRIQSAEGSRIQSVQGSRAQSPEPSSAGVDGEER